MRFNFTVLTFFNFFQLSSPLPSPPAESDFTLIEQLQLGAVKDFHLLDFLGGNSLVKEYDLFSWWSPASWFRLALEYMHFNIDMPWWLTVMCGKLLSKSFQKRMPSIITEVKYITAQSIVHGYDSSALQGLISKSAINKILIRFGLK